MAVAVTVTLGGKKLISPAEIYRYALANRTPTTFWQRANSYRFSRGPKPGHAWVLMNRKDADALDVSEYHELKWKEGKTTIAIPSLSIVKSSTMSIAVAGDEKAPRLIYLEDRRRQLAMSSINAQYNVRRPAPAATSGTGLYYSDSLDSAALWTWQTLLDNIWDSLPTDDDAPTLPYTPDGTPEGWRFIGVSAWAALHVILAKVGCTSVYNPLLDVFTYVRLGTVQTGLQTKIDKVEERKLYDFDPETNCHLANMPSIVRVFFARRETYHGIEQDTPDTSNWEMQPAVSKDYVTQYTGALADTVLPVWDDLPALFDSAGSNTNSAALQTRANEIGLNIARRIDTSEDPMRRRYSGIVHTILPGSEVSDVAWRDYGDGSGLVTEIMLAAKAEPEAGVSGDRRIDEHTSTPDLARPGHPLYPRVAQAVQVDDGASATGADLTANASGLFPGFVIRWTGSAYDTMESCWIRPADLSGASESAIVQLKQKDRLLARLYGVATHSGSTRPVYLVRKGEAGSMQPQFMVQVAGTPDGGGQPSEETSGGTPVCVWDVNLITPAQTSGEMCGDGTNTLGAEGWFAFLGSDGAADPFYLTKGGKFLAYSAGFDFTPTDGVARPLYLAAKDQETYYFKAKENWRQETPNLADTVLCNPCEDVDGVSVDTGVDKTVYLLQVAEMDPNVVNGDVIAARLGADGKFVCVSDYLDAKIGTVTMWVGTEADVPPGWAVMNGSSNSVSSGGSGIDMTDRFVKGGLTPGEMGGEEEHVHNLVVIVEAHSSDELSVTLDHTHTATVDVEDHTVADLKHNHPITLDTVSEGWQAFYEAWTADRARHLSCTDDPVEAGVGCVAASDWGPLVHVATVEVAQAYGSINVPAPLIHTAARSYMEPAEHAPPFTVLIFIERINNAVNA